MSCTHPDCKLFCFFLFSFAIVGGMWYATFDLLWILPLFHEKRALKGCFNQIMGLMKKIFGDYSSRELKAIYPIVDKIESMSE